ncbi:MAG: hypothetical protein P8Z79_14815 [Sedimentisphaerales bacterium]|jgi:hypothetical protein
MRIKGNRLMPCILATVLASSSFAVGGEPAQMPRKPSDKLLLEIMDLHAQLVTKEAFLAQAKMVGAYLEAARQSEEPERAEVYSRVVGILSQIKNARPISPMTDQGTRTQVAERAANQRPSPEEDRTAYERGAALLEIFRTDPKTNATPELPVIRTTWKRDMIYSGPFIVPERVQDVGGAADALRTPRLPYVAKFSFYYQAEQQGQYGFTIIRSGYSECKLTVGGALIAHSGKPQQSSEPRTIQVGCILKKGLHKIQLSLASSAAGEGARNSASSGGPDSFQVKVLTPQASDAVQLTKDMMLLKKS